MTYRIALVPDDNGAFLVTCPALPGVVTFGDADKDCVRHGRDAIEEAIAARISGGEDVPRDTAEIKAESRVLPVTIPALTKLKVDLYRACRAQCVTRAELARRLKWNRNSVDRLFMLDHNSRLEQIEAAAGAIGQLLKVELEPA